MVTRFFKTLCIIFICNFQFFSWVVLSKWKFDLLYLKCGKLFPGKRFYFFRLIWVFSWRIRLQFRLNFLLQTIHSYGFSPVWVLSCLLRSELLVNLFSQTIHSYGFSSVWVLSWVKKFYLRLIFLPQTIQSCGFSPVWVLSWMISWDLYLKCLLQTKHSFLFLTEDKFLFRRLVSFSLTSFDTLLVLI